MNADFNENERRLIESILKNYNFNVISINKVRSAYKVETESGNICLKKMKHGRRKVLNGKILVDGLLKNKFDNIAMYYKTKDDRLYVTERKYIFYATEWIDGEECDMSNLQETCECVKLLAQFHISSKSIDTKDLKLENNIRNWPKVFSSNIADLERYRRVIQNKKIKNEFDLTYEKFIDSMYDRGMMAIRLLNNSQYYKVIRTGVHNYTICHDSFYYQNIIKKDGKYYLIDLDSIMIDLQVNDLGKLIRRLMFKSEYQWDFSKAKQIIESYASVNKLTKNDLEIMLALIIFPHKFWKLGKKRYSKNKNWNEAKYYHKLLKLIKYDELEQNFLQEYLKYLNEISGDQLGV